tara:strand:+ start:631 stop:1347 length:717 start_codon:yes stop_codon:yes gene_type:complete
MSFIIERLLAKIGFETPIRSKQRPFNPNYYRGFSLENTQDYALLMIGAHNGLKTKYFVKEAAEYGKVCLVEPVPHLFQTLTKTHSKLKNVFLVNKCVTNTAMDTVDFFAPTKDANKLQHYGDQLGSLNKEHATDHDKRMVRYIEKISVPSITTESLLKAINCVDINLLYLDTEGHDVEIIKNFPFDKIQPKAILFEHKHADGTHNLGPKFASTVKLLNKLRYRVRCVDRENCLAIKES